MCILNSMYIALMFQAQTIMCAHLKEALMFIRSFFGLKEHICCVILHMINPILGHGQQLT